MNMKRLMLIFLIGLLILPVVFAGETYKLDFSEKNQYVVGMNIGDRVEFNLNDERHTLIIRNIMDNVVDVTAFVNLNTQNYPYYASIGKTAKGMVNLKLDTNRDDVDDILISVARIKDKNAQLLFSRLNDNKSTNNMVGPKPKKFNYYWVLIPLILIVFLLIVLKIINKK